MSTLTFVTLMETSNELKSAPSLTFSSSSSSSSSSSDSVVQVAEPDYHHAYPASAPGVDLILASSDRQSCHFAIACAKLSCHPTLFVYPSRSKTLARTGIPIVHLDESKEVIEIILTCVNPDVVPDLSSYDFNHLLGALEAAATRYDLEHVERLCLLALGAYYQQKPVHIFALAENYGCHWLAELASKHTLSLDINHPECKSLLLRESFDALVELHSHRRSSARRILKHLKLKSVTHNSRCSPRDLIKFWNLSLGRLRRAISISNAGISMQELFEPELARASKTLNCPACLHQLYECSNQAELSLAKVRSWALSTDPVSPAQTGPKHITRDHPFDLIH